MAFKLNISENGKAWKMELEGENLVGKSVGDVFDGKEISSDLAGYKLQITGGSDTSGFPLAKDVEGLGIKRLLLTKGFGMRDNGKGIRRRKTVRGKQIALTTSLINIKVLGAGNKSLSEVFPDQNKKEEAKPVEAAPAA